VLELFGLAVVSAFWPTLLVVDLIAFHTRTPQRILISFLAGGLITTVGVGYVVVVQLQSTSLVGHSRSTFDPAVYLAVGGLALLCALALERVRHRPPKPKPEQGHAGSEQPSFAERAVARGAPLAFVGGVVLNLFPGVFPLIALKDIAERDYSRTETLVVLFGFYVIMFVFVEAPIAAYVFAPDWTRTHVERFNSWLRRNRLGVVEWVLVAGGLYLLVRGIVLVA
jgi:Sap, sulfolipid-1-addressing protein